MKTVALLRGINVGGNRKVPMADLRNVFEAAGCMEVVTYIQSGNVVFAAPGKNRQGLREQLEEAVADRFGFQAPLVLRDRRALQGLAGRNPFIRGANADRLYVGFLRDTPAKRLLPELPLGPGEEVRLVDGDIFLHLPGGVGKTKLTNALFDRLCGTVCTIRNWNTVLALLDLATRK